MSKNPKSEVFDVTLNAPEVCFVQVRVNGETVVHLRFERNEDGYLDLNLWESANDDQEIANTYPEFFPEVTA